MASQVFTVAAWRYISDQLDPNLRRERDWKRLQARIQKLPYELRMIILTDWIRNNAPKIVNGKLEHLLLTDTITPPSKTVNLALLHSAPIVLEKSVWRNGQAWSASERQFFLSMEFPLHYDTWLPVTPPLNEHERLCRRRQGRNCIRIVCRLVVYSGSTHAQRVRYNSSGEKIGDYSPWDWSSFDDRVTWLEVLDKHAARWSKKIAARNDVPLENVTFEVVFKHKCSSENCTGLHLTYEIPRVIALAFASVHLYALVALYQGIRIAVGGKEYWHECCEYFAGRRNHIMERVLNAIVVLFPATVLGVLLWVVAQILFHIGWMLLIAGRSWFRFWWGVYEDVQRDLAERSEKGKL